MNRNTYTSDYSVPSLSLSSSRSKKTIPTKDTTEISRPIQVKPRAQMLDRLSRPPIFNSKVVQHQKLSIDSSTGTSHRSIQTTTTIQKNSLSRNVYLRQQQPPILQNQVTFRSPQQQYYPLQPPSSYTSSSSSSIQRASIARSSSGTSLRNPQTMHDIGVGMGINMSSGLPTGAQFQRRMQQKKIDVNKSLFDRRIKKLLQQAEFYNDQLMNMYPDQSDVLNKQLQILEQYRKDALSFSINTNLIDLM